VVFHCKDGHEFSIASLVPLASPKLRLALRDLLGVLERDLENMAGIAAQASKAGYGQIAEVYYRQIPRLKRRVAELRGGLSQLGVERPDAP